MDNITEVEKEFKIIKQKRFIVRNRLHIENINLENKILFLSNYIQNIKDVLDVTYRILSWEDINSLEEILKDKLYYKIDYRNGKRPGKIVLKEVNIDFNFLQNILVSHFNYELALEPSVNIRPQILIRTSKYSIVFDIYDDRGVDVYYKILGNVSDG
jgi:hypothetical protein